MRKTFLILAASLTLGPAVALVAPASGQAFGQVSGQATGEALAADVEIPDDLANRLPCDDGASRVLADWLLAQVDVDASFAVISALARDISACAPVREAAIGLSVGAEAGPAPSATAMTSAIPEAFIEAEQRAERLTFSVEPPPRNLTRNRIYRP